jgi:hypothetical protein
MCVSIRRISARPFESAGQSRRIRVDRNMRCVDGIPTSSAKACRPTRSCGARQANDRLALLRCAGVASCPALVSRQVFADDVLMTRPHLVFDLRLSSRTVFGRSTADCRHDEVDVRVDLQDLGKRPFESAGQSRRIRVDRNMRCVDDIPAASAKGCRPTTIRESRYANRVGAGQLSSNVSASRCAGKRSRCADNLAASSSTVTTCGCAPSSTSGCPSMSIAALSPA